ncbi:uncharacterized protein ACRADG_003300 isoform 2-T2 [Cochliomyia hominivorax]
MSDRERSSPTLIETGLKNLIGGRDGNYPLISGINGKTLIDFIYINYLYYKVSNLSMKL